MAEWYETCRYCGEVLDFSAAAIALGGDPPSYQPFMEDWRGGLVEVAHPKCFALAEGLDALLAAVAFNDARVAGA